MCRFYLPYQNSRIPRILQSKAQSNHGLFKKAPSRNDNDHPHLLCTLRYKLESNQRDTGNIDNNTGYTTTSENEKCPDKYFFNNSFLYDTYANNILGLKL